MTRPQNKTARVLVLDGDQTSSLAIVRSLGRQGLSVDLGAPSEDPLSHYSRFCAASFVYPNPISNSAEFVATVLDRVRSENYDLVIPVTDDTIQPLAESRELFTDLTILALADDEQLELMTDKAATFALARKLGVPLPESWPVDSLDALDARQESWKFPVVVKPSRSVSATPGQGGKRVSLAVRYAHDDQELRRLCSEALKQGPVVLQEYLAGDGYGLEVLAHEGKILASFQHHRLHQMPLSGGGSSYRESVPVDEVLLQDAQKLISASQWTGVAMVEFKANPQDRSQRWLMEVNGRFWGSLPLCTAAGADFPYWLYELLVQGNETLRPAARHGVVCRKFSRELWWYLDVLRRSDPNPIIVWPSRPRAMLSLLRMFTPSHYWDAQSFSDPIPGFVDAFRSLKGMRQRFADRAHKNKLLQVAGRQREEFSMNKNIFKGVNSLLFLCYGNINRSALADTIVRENWKELDLDVHGAGFFDIEGRLADPNMVQAAAEQEIDLTSSRSKRVTREMVDDADLILVMDKEQLAAFHREFSDASEKAMLLGVLDSEGKYGLEVQDPYGAPYVEYQNCRDQIQHCLTGLRRGIEEAR